MRREVKIKVGDFREGDTFVRWPEEFLGNEREVIVLRNAQLPTRVGSRVQDEHGTIFVLMETGTWVSLHTGGYRAPAMMEMSNWTPYLPEVSEEAIHKAICQYADRVSAHNGRTWLTEFGRKKFAEEIMKGLKNG